MDEAEERLINERDDEEEDDRRWTLDKKRAFICCCVCLISVIFIALAVTMGGTISRKFRLQFMSHNKFDDEQVSDITKVVFPQNLSELLSLNVKLCQSVASNKTSFLNKNNPNNIYIVKSERNLTDEQACGVESILRLFPDKTIYLIDFNKNDETSYSKCSARPNYLGLLLYLYKDRLQLVLADQQQYFKNTPLSNFTNREDKFEFMAMLLTAYKYGGFVASPDVVMTSRDLVECFPEETIVEPFAILSAKKCDDFLHYLMQTFDLCGHVCNSTLESVLTESADLYSRSLSQSARREAARRLNPSELSYDAHESSGSFLKLKRFKQGDDRWVSDLSHFCKQVVQAYLGIKINKMEVEEETSRIKSSIAGNNTCDLARAPCENTERRSNSEE